MAESKLDRLKRAREEQKLSRRLDECARILSGAVPPRHGHDVRHAARELAQHARDQDVPLLCDCLQREDAEVRSAVQSSLWVASTWKRGSAGFWHAVFEPVSLLLLHGDETATGQTAGLLLHADPARAVALLTDDSGLFRPEHPKAWAACVALSQWRVRCPCERLQRLHDGVVAMLTQPGADVLYGNVLELFAWARCGNAREVIERALASPSEQIREAARHALHVLRHEKWPGQGQRRNW